MSRTHIKMHSAAYWVGLDVSKRTFDAAIVSVGQQLSSLADVPAQAFARTRAGVEEFLRWLDTQAVQAEQGTSVRCVMEATGRYSTELAVWMLQLRSSLAPAIESPRQTAPFIRSLGMRNLTDKLAARGLAIYGKERQPNAYEPPSPEEQELREVCRYRDVLVRQRTAEKNRGGEVQESAFVQKNHRKRLRLLEADIARAEAEMRDLVNRHQGLKQDVDLMTTIYGVGFLTAVIVRAELGDLRRFDKARQLSAHAGLNPAIQRSGTSVHRKTRMGKMGNPRVRHALYLCSIVVIQGRNDLQRTYARLLDNGKAPMAALGVIMRKLLCLMRAILISGIPYEPNREHRGEMSLCPNTLTT